MMSFDMKTCKMGIWDDDDGGTEDGKLASAATAAFVPLQQQPASASKLTPSKDYTFLLCLYHPNTPLSSSLSL